MAAAGTIAPDATPDDADLLERIGNGDRASFTILYERYFPRVRSFVARRISNRADAEEAVQEAFINIFSSLTSFRGEAPFAAWVLGVTRRTVAGRFKKKRPLTVSFDEAEAQLDLTGHSEPTPLQNLECRERVRRLEDAAAHELSTSQRRLFELHHLRHHSIREISLLVNKSEESVKSSLYRARKILLAG